MATFKDRLKELRLKRNLTLDKIADDLNTTKATLSRYENGLREPKVDFLNQIATYFDVTVDYLLGRTNNPKGSIEPEGNLHKDNTEYKAYDEIFQKLRERLEEEGIVEKGQPVSKEIIEMLLKFGSGAAMEILKARNKEDM